MALLDFNTDAFPCKSDFARHGLHSIIDREMLDIPRNLIYDGFVL